MQTDPSIKLIYVDLFCGAGGTSTGVERATIAGSKCARVIACVNHDKNAILSHAANHPDTLHFTEDIRTLDLTALIQHIALMRMKYPNALLVLWASLECTNFSKAKGGLPRDADSRTLAESLYRYIQAIDPDYIQIENVEEFMSWGPLDGNGKPISKLAGTDYTNWVNSVKDYLYDFDYRVLNAANYGAYTSRKRYFGIFAKYGLPIVFPEQTHAKNSTASLKKWKAVKDVLELQDSGISIFGRKKALVDKTFWRVHAGLVKFVAGGKETFIQQRNSGNPFSKLVDIEGPSRTLTATGGNQDLVSAKFLSKYYSGSPESKNIGIDGPAHTITAVDHHSLVSANFISAYYGNGDNVSSIESPSPVVSTKDRLALVKPQFIDANFGSSRPVSTDQPLGTLTTKDKYSIVSCDPFIDQQFGNSKPAAINNPIGAITANPKYNLVSCKPFIINSFSGGGQHLNIDKPCSTLLSVPKQNLVTCGWLMDTNFGNTGSRLDDPSNVITANRKWQYLVNPQYKNAGKGINEPCFTLIARMDKMPPSIATIETDVTKDLPRFIRVEGNVVIYEIYESDSPARIAIKEFMAMYGIRDIKMRMLKIPELLQIMGFPVTYKLIGTKAEQKKYIGNAVETTMAKVMCEALVGKLIELEIAA